MEINFNSFRFGPNGYIHLPDVWYYISEEYELSSNQREIGRQYINSILSIKKHIRSTQVAGTILGTALFFAIGRTGRI